MKIALFLGSGASVVYGKDTTSMFRDRLTNKYSESQGSSNFHNLFLNILNYYKDRDIEYVLQCLKDINDFKSKEGGRFLLHSLTSSYRDTNCDINLPELKDMVGKIYSFIEEEIFSHYSWKPENSTNLKKILDTIYKRISGGNEVRVFTTNYDRDVENFCTENSLHFIDGFKLDYRSQQYIWNSGSYDDIDADIEERLFLYKLHGSLDWKKHSQFGFVRMTGVESRVKNDTIIDHLIIAPTLSPKDGHELEPFKSILSKFVDFMNKADGCIIIGFSFRDVHVKRVFRSFIEAEKPIVIISPDALHDFYHNLLGSDVPEELTADQEMTLTDLNGVKCRINLKNERVSTENIKK